MTFNVGGWLLISSPLNVIEYRGSRLRVDTCARRALNDSFSLEMLFSTTSSLTRLSRC